MHVKYDFVRVQCTYMCCSLPTVFRLLISCNVYNICDEKKTVLFTGGRSSLISFNG